MLLLNAGDLLAQALVDVAQRIGRWRSRGACIDRVDGEEQILAAEIVIEASGAEVLFDVLRRMAEGFGDAAGISVRQEFRSVRDRPKIQQRHN